MLDALDHHSGPRTQKAPTGLSAAVPAPEAQEAIRKAFPCEGDLRVHPLWSTDGISRFRASWFREEAGKTTIVKSLFLSVTRTESGLVVRDDTVV